MTVNFAGELRSQSSDSIPPQDIEVRSCARRALATIATKNGIGVAEMREALEALGLLPEDDHAFTY